ncbi:MAG: hypothetical protein KIT73_20675, partial [Burkholderiales bacterium]|nr:hypothetical protein [Burkholderiales bacterium]
SNDSVFVEFGDGGSASADDSIFMTAAFDQSSVVSVLTTLHYSEDLAPTHTVTTDASAYLNGAADLRDNSARNAIRSPSINTLVQKTLSPQTNWGFTVTDSNKHVSWGNHYLNPVASITSRNDWAGRTSALASDPPSASATARTQSSPESVQERSERTRSAMVDWSASFAASTASGVDGTSREDSRSRSGYPGASSDGRRHVGEGRTGATITKAGRFDAPMAQSIQREVRAAEDIAPADRSHGAARLPDVSKVRWNL